MRTWMYNLRGDTLREKSHTGCRKRRRGTHHDMDYRPRPRLVLAKKKREAKRKEKFPPTDVVCLNENRGNIETEH